MCQRYYFLVYTISAFGHFKVVTLAAPSKAGYPDPIDIILVATADSCFYTGKYRLEMKAHGLSNLLDTELLYPVFSPVMESVLLRE